MAIGAIAVGGLALGSKVLQAALGVGLHSLAALRPAGRADLAVLLGELESLDETDGLLDIAADGQVVDGDLSEDALGVDDEQAAQGNALFLDEDAVAARNLLRSVGDKGKLQVRTQAALLSGLLNPGEVGEVRVGGNAEHGGVDGAEALEGVVVLDDLGRADEGEVHGVEEEDDPARERLAMVEIFRVFAEVAILPLSLVLRERDVLELASGEEGSGGKVRSRTLNESGRHGDCGDCGDCDGCGRLCWMGVASSLDSVKEKKTIALPECPEAPDNWEWVPWKGVE